MCEVEQVRAKYARLRGVMDERVTRLWAATEAEALGYGGIAAVEKATGISKSRIRAGVRDLADLALHPPTEPARTQRIRRPGAGRPALVERDPTLERPRRRLAARLWRFSHTRLAQRSRLATKRAKSLPK
jgi:hypothetical protein